MEFLFEKNKKEKLVAIFDIGSGSVGATLAHIPKDKSKIPTLFASVRTDISSHEENDFDAFQNNMLEALSQTAKKLYALKAGTPSSVYCVLASPWYVSETRIIKMSRPGSFVFTQKLANELVAKELVSLTTNYNKKYGTDISAPEQIEQTISRIHLNGYPVISPIGKKTRQVEMDMIISLAPKDVLVGIKEKISETFHSVPVEFSSFITSAYLAIRDKYITEESYLLVDISGEITDIAIVNKDSLKVSLSFPFGRQTFFRFLRKNLGSDERETASLFSLYNAKTLEVSKKDQLDKSLNSIASSWSGAFRESIASAPNTLVLPKTVFLMADTDIKQWFASIIRCEEYLNTKIVDNTCHVVTLEGPEFLDMCKVKNGSCDPFLMVEAIAIMRKQQ